MKKLDESPQDTIAKWLIDYTYNCALQGFGEMGTVWNALDRDFIQGLFNMFESGHDSSEQCQQQLMKLRIMCFLLDGEEGRLVEEEEGDATRSILEEALELIFNSHVIFKERTMSWILEIKRQAVFVFCRTADFEVAELIFQRLLPQGKVKSTESKQLRHQIEEVLESKDPTHPHLQSYPYQGLLKKSYNVFKNLEDDPHHIPYLHTAALQYQRETTEVGTLASKSIACQTEGTPAPNVGDIVMTTEFGQLAMKSRLPNLTGKAYMLPAKAKQRFLKKIKAIRRNKEMYLNSVPSFENLDESVLMSSSGESSYELSEEEIDRNDKETRVRHSHVAPDSSSSNRRKRPVSPNESDERIRQKQIFKWKRGKEGATRIKTSYSKKSHRLLKARNHYEVTSSDGVEQVSSDEENELRGPSSIRLPPKLPLRRSLAPHLQRTACRMAWSIQEEENLYQAVQECGVGNWSEILVWDGPLSFPLRTNVNLKDKWRTMTKQGRVAELREKYGPIK